AGDRRGQPAGRDPVPEDQPGDGPDDGRPRHGRRSAARRARDQARRGADMNRARALLLASVLAAAAALAGACVGEVSHVFGGYAYDSQQNCLQPSGGIDVVAGADPGQCPMLRCWEAPDGSIYVTDEACDAPPDYIDHTND